MVMIMWNYNLTLFDGGNASSCINIFLHFNYVSILVSHKEIFSLFLLSIVR